MRLAPVDDADAQAKQLVSWLIDEGVARRNERWVEGQERQLLPGPACIDAVEHSDDDCIEYSFPSHPLAVASRRRRPIADLLQGGIDVVTGRCVWTAGENTEAPRCPSCRSAMADDAFYAYVEQWSEGAEPEVACQACGATRALGDWDGGPWGGCVVGDLGLRFNGWLALRDAFVQRLRERMGGRTRLIVAHW